MAPKFVRVHYGSEPTDVGVAVYSGPTDRGPTFSDYLPGLLEDVFDVSPYGSPEGPTEARDREERIAALDALIELANIGLAALQLREEYEQHLAEVEAEGLDEFGSWQSWEDEAQAAHQEGALEVIDRAIKAVGS